jgi:hypothetical protein
MAIASDPIVSSLLGEVDLFDMAVSLDSLILVTLLNCYYAAIELHSTVWNSFQKWE